ncbi:hypothetical protein [Candidatus Fukatsuia endosymbiont of Tuberolachnus salignus]|uniref:hypothetical protein n=1 Tax=Candidatus Fukatsuia endosymbiont of Tuberolachnus salignus TaxID=3077957 RepID=UPI00313E12E2
MKKIKSFIKILPILLLPMPILAFGAEKNKETPYICKSWFKYLNLLNSPSASSLIYTQISKWCVVQKHVVEQAKFQAKSRREHESSFYE